MIDLANMTIAGGWVREAILRGSTQYTGDIDIVSGPNCPHGDRIIGPINDVSCNVFCLRAGRIAVLPSLPMVNADLAFDSILRGEFWALPFLGMRPTSRSREFERRGWVQIIPRRQHWQPEPLSADRIEIADHLMGEWRAAGGLQRLCRGAA